MDYLQYVHVHCPTLISYSTSFANFLANTPLVSLSKLAVVTVPPFQIQTVSLQWISTGDFPLQILR